ncbi:MAG: BMP family ABC transporter substrate-binding protein [Omnitrophica WOR_2 bacterium]
MRSKSIWLLISTLILISLLASACQPAATVAPTQAIAPTEASQPTTAPTEAVQPTAAPTETSAAVAETPVMTATQAITPTAAVTSTAASKPITFGMILVGPYNDSGWSQATYEGGQYVESKDPGTKLIYIDNAFSHQGTTPAQLAEQLLSQGANVIIFNSDSFMDDSNTFATAHTDIPVIMLSGDQEWKEGQDYKGFPNMIDIMGRMEYMKEVAGCAAALTTQSGKIGFLGPLINPETRRLAASAFLGAKYCWTKVLNKDAKTLTFSVTWIGNWFNIPGQTLDPTAVADQFYNSGYDVVISGIDTTEALVEAKKMNDAGKKVFAIPYDYHNACSQAPSVCLGVPYFNWGPALLKNIKAIQDGTWTAHFEWNPPDWEHFNQPDYGAVGFNTGDALSADNKTKLEAFITDLSKGLNLWTGPINLQDKTVYLKDGEVATDQQVWYLPQLLEGMEGKSK